MLPGRRDDPRGALSSGVYGSVFRDPLLYVLVLLRVGRSLPGFVPAVLVPADRVPAGLEPVGRAPAGREPVGLSPA